MTKKCENERERSARAAREVSQLLESGEISQTEAEERLQQILGMDDDSKMLPQRFQ